MQDWKAWEGRVVDETYPIRQYLADGVFLTEFGKPEPRKAAIKIVLGNPEDTASQLERLDEGAPNSRWPGIYRATDRADCALAPRGKAAAGGCSA